MSRTGTAYKCPILSRMMFLNSDYSKEEYDACHALVNECVTKNGIPYEPSDPDSFRNLLIMIPLLMMHYRRIPRAKWRDCVTQNGKHWMEQDGLLPEKFLNSIIGYHPTLDSPCGGFGYSRTPNQRKYNPHLGGFGSVGHGYGDQGDFYDTYAKQTESGNGNPQQFPLPPVPYSSNPHPQSRQCYDTPYNPGNIPQSYAKYPSVFQPSLPGPSPALNQTDTNVDVGVQPQSNPYGQGLYQQDGYDIYQQHSRHSRHQHSYALGLGQKCASVVVNDYNKQVYGSAGQGFMSLGGHSGGAGSGFTGTGAGPHSVSALEPSYRYQNDGEVGVGGGLGPIQSGPDQIQPQGPGAAQEGQGGPQGQEYYGGNHFGGDVGGTGVGGGVGGPQQGVQHQQGEPQGHLAYPHGASDGSFYPY